MITIILCKGKGVDSEELNLFNKEKVADIHLFERFLIGLSNQGFNESVIISDEDCLLNELHYRYPSSRVQRKSKIDDLLINRDILIVQNNVVANKKQISNLLEVVNDYNQSFIGKNDKEEKCGIVFLKSSDIKSNNLEINNISSLNGKVKEIILDDPPKKISVEEINSNAARDFLFNHISKNVSGWVSKNINSKISIPISKILVKMNFHPNWITFFVGCIGISCGFFYASNSPIVAAIILQISTILDRCDGEVARIRLKESKFGQWFDTALDQISYFSMFVGISICLNNPKFFTINPEINILRQISILNVLLYIIFLTIILFFMLRRTKNGSLAYYPLEIDRIVPLENRSLFYKIMTKFRFLAKREFFSPAMIIVSLIGYEFATLMAFVILFFGIIHLAADFLEARKRIDITY
ncbi:MAG: CDP-alcohol phosphatidyltransferase family protein [Thermodesulfobacteriota bacterium]|nr:CDP-alcohol phosphatidyltransferase family protein [Thermodesulfobacteriota bacterium]